MAALSDVIPTLPNITELRLFPAQYADALVCVEGYLSATDACPARLFRIYAGSPPVADDGGIYITGAAYYYVLQYSGAIDARWYGVLGDGTDDTAAIQNTLNSVMALGTATRNATILWPQGSVLSKPVWFGGNPQYSLTFEGLTGGSSGNAQPTWVWSGASYPTMLILMSASTTILHGMTFDGSAGGGLQQCVQVATTRENTTLNGAVTAGAGVTATIHTPTLPNVPELAVGTALPIGEGTAAYEVVYVQTVSSATTFVADFRFNHASGEFVGTANPTTEGVKFKECGFIVPAGTATAGILWGNPFVTQSPDVALGATRDCNFVGNSSSPSYSGQRWIGGGNVKDFTNVGNKYLLFKKPLAIEGLSGHFTVRDEEFLVSTDSDIYVGGGEGTLTIEGCGSESNGALFLNLLSENSSVATLIGNTVEYNLGFGPAGGVVVICYSSLNLFGNNFFNPGGVAQIQVLNLVPNLSSVTNSQITSIGNYYQGARPDSVVFEDFSARVVSPVGDSMDNSLRIVSLGDFGDNGALPPIFGQMANLAGALSKDSMSTGVAMETTGRVGTEYTRWAIPLTALTTGSVTAIALCLGTIPVGTQIVAAKVQIATQFTGIAGGVTVQLGTSFGGQELILSASATATAGTTYGLLDNDLGTDLVRANAVQGGDLKLWAAGGNLFCTVASTGGHNLSGLTAGALLITVFTRRELLTT